MEGKVVKVSGPLVKVEGLEDAKMFDVVKIGTMGIVGEIVEIHNGVLSAQVYEDTAGIGPGDKVESTLEPLSIELAPGLVGSIFDGIGRPLDVLYRDYGSNITRGASVDSIDRSKKWHFFATAKVGDFVKEGDTLGFVQETASVKHKILVPQGVYGEVKTIAQGEKTIVDTIATIKTTDGTKKVTMLQKWPVRRQRPYKNKFVPSTPMLTGQRVIDSLFPIARGGVAAVPGPFGSGKTVVQHQLAKWADADIIVYIGCGERGNEMTDVLNEFPTITDPKSGKPLMDKTILIANTSDMPVSAREASIYTGITIAEYYRDMGYNVALMADSTSRWAEALREMSSRLEEMPGEEGYPAYLASRLAQFYERAGLFKTLSGDQGSITAIGAVSPPGGDMSEPVAQATLRIVKVFWCLSSSLAYKRHFPAIDWSQSYSLYSARLADWFADNVSNEFAAYKDFASEILQKENELNEIVRLIGSDSLSNADKILLDAARMLREDFLHQNAFDKIDTYTSIQKQNKMLSLVYNYYNLATEALQGGAKIRDILSLPIKESIAKAKYVPEKNIYSLDEMNIEMKKQFKRLTETGEEL